MVWGAIAYDAKSPLVFVERSLTAQHYVQEILQPVAVPFLNSQVQPLFQQDNARPHTAAISRACLQGVDTIPWPAYSPDLSPIENVWMPWDRMSGRHHYLEICRNYDKEFKPHGTGYRRTS